MSSPYTRSAWVRPDTLAPKHPFQPPGAWPNHRPRVGSPDNLGEPGTRRRALGGHHADLPGSSGAGVAVEGLADDPGAGAGAEFGQYVRHMGLHRVTR